MFWFFALLVSLWSAYVFFIAYFLPWYLVFCRIICHSLFSKLVYFRHLLSFVLCKLYASINMQHLSVPSGGPTCLLGKQVSPDTEASCLPSSFLKNKSSTERQCHYCICLHGFIQLLCTDQKCWYGQPDFKLVSFFATSATEMITKTWDLRRVMLHVLSSFPQIVVFVVAQLQDRKKKKEQTLPVRSPQCFLWAWALLPNILHTFPDAHVCRHCCGARTPVITGVKGQALCTEG